MRASNHTHLNQSQKNRVNELTCPITLQVFNDPHIIDCGHTFEKEALMNLIKKSEKDHHSPLCPVCQQEIKRYLPSRLAKQQVATVLSEVPELTTDQYVVEDVKADLAERINKNETTAAIELLKKFPNLAHESLNSAHVTALLLFSHKGNLEGVKLVLGMGADVNTRNSFNETPLMCAAHHGYDEILEMLLLTPSIELECKSQGNTPLQWAARKGRARCCRLLIERGASLIAVNAEGKTAVQSANGDAKAVFKEPYSIFRTVQEYLSENRLDIVIDLLISELKHSENSEALFKMCMELVREQYPSLLNDMTTQFLLHSTQNNDPLLLEKITELLNADINLSLDKLGNTVLHLFVEKNNINGVKKAIDLDADINALNNRHETAAMFAAYQGNETILQILLNTGRTHLDIASQNLPKSHQNGRTALHWAAQRGHHRCCRLLVQAGAATHLTDVHGKTPVDLATGKALQFFDKMNEKKLAPYHFLENLSPVERYIEKTQHQFFLSYRLGSQKITYAQKIKHEIRDAALHYANSEGTTQKTSTSFNEGLKKIVTPFFSRYEKDPLFNQLCKSGFWGSPSEFKDAFVTLKRKILR